MIKNKIGVGIIGYGVVGSGVATLLQEQSDHITSILGFPLTVAAVARKSNHKPSHLPEHVFFTNDANALITHPDVDIVLELIGGTTHAKDIVLSAFAHEKPVITANKALLAEHGIELHSLAQEKKLPLGYEASVAGAVPIINTLASSLVHNSIDRITGVLNGTCNFILSSMADKDLTFNDALHLAQKLGYAEAIPDLDIDGSDSLHKLVVLILLTHRIFIPFATCYRKGIADVLVKDIHFGRSLGLELKSLANSWFDEGSVSVRVEPAFVEAHSQLGQLVEANNGIEVSGSFSGPIFLAGAGAGSNPTASAVVADCLAIARTMVHTQFQNYDYRPITTSESKLDITTSWYLRITLDDSPGSLNSVSTIFSDHGVNIESLTQNHEDSEQESDGTTSVPLLLIVDPTDSKKIDELCDSLELLSMVQSAVVRYPIYRKSL